MLALQQPAAFRCAAELAAGRAGRGLSDSTYASAGERSFGAVKRCASSLCGAQVSSKIGVIETLIDKVDKIILGGGMIFTFYKARGLAVGSSLVEEDKLELAKSLEEVRLLLL